jgi:predicted AAA+ superfamily ATPase
VQTCLDFTWDFPKLDQWSKREVQISGRKVAEVKAKEGARSEEGPARLHASQNIERAFLEGGQTAWTARRAVEVSAMVLLIIRIISNTTVVERVPRRLDLKGLLAKKSFFLFGPRGTGKSSLVDQQLMDRAVIIDLLRSDLLIRLSAHPEEIEGLIAASPRRKWIVIDEIQRVPALLSEVHHLIERKGWRFLLTGSSARKLRRGSADLLAGRAWIANLYPLTWSEIPAFDLRRYLRFGGLPSVYLGESPEEELSAYVAVYLQEEIRAEGIIRRLPPFARFLRVAALSSGQLLNYAQLGSDAEAPASTVREYFSVLEDTLVGWTLEPWRESRKRKAIQTGKFYFFDPGVMHALAGTKALDRNSDLYGRSFEHFIGMELRAYVGYARTGDTLTFWRSTHGHEVDFLVEGKVGVEVKATRKASMRDAEGLRRLADERVVSRLYLVSEDPIAARREGIDFLPWQTFLARLWDGDLF